MSRRRNIRNSRYSNAYYSYSSEAYKYYPEEDDFNYSSKKKRKRFRTRKKAKKSKAPSMQYEIAVNEKQEHSLKTYFSICVLFICSMALLCSYAANSKQREYISSLNDELKHIQENNAFLETELVQSIDLGTVEKVAKTKLGMQKPEEYQQVYINVPKQSYTIQYETVSDINLEKKFSFEKILNYFFKE